MTHQPECQTPHYNKTASPDITTVSNTLYYQTSWTTQYALSSDHLPIITTINIPQTTTKPTDFHQLQLDTIYRRHRVRFCSDHHTHQHTANIIFTKIIMMAVKHNIPKGKMHSNCRLLPNHIVCKITQRNNIRRANTCDPALKLLRGCTASNFSGF